MEKSATDDDQQYHLADGEDGRPRGRAEDQELRTGRRAGTEQEGRPPEGAPPFAERACRSRRYDAKPRPGRPRAGAPAPCEAE